MALLRVNLSPRNLAGLYSRIVRRELGLPVFLPRFSEDLGELVGLFARSLTVALGQAFASGEEIRTEFALALRDRLRQYERKSPIRQAVPLSEAFDHSVALSEIAAGQLPEGWEGTISISEESVARATQADVRRLTEFGGDVNWSRQEFSRSLWVEGPYPFWWRRRERSPEAPDSWVEPMAQLGKPLWSSRLLSGDDLTYLLNFGLDRIDAKPALIEPWTRSVSSLVAAASRPRANIRDVVNCCRVDP